MTRRPPEFAFPWPDTATLSEIPGGAAGTATVLAQMGSMIRHGKTDLRIRGRALRIVAGLPHKAFVLQLRAVQRWVQENIQFVRDVRGVETVTDPVYTLATRAEDCDGQSVLVAALLESIGFRTRLVASGPDPETFVHVHAEAYAAGTWYALETTEPWPLGRAADFQWRMIENV